MKMKEHNETIEYLKSGKVKVPILVTAGLVYLPTKTWINLLVAPAEFKYEGKKHRFKPHGEEYPILIYLEFGSYDGELSLIDMTKQPENDKPAFHDLIGYYDLNKKKGRIDNIYLNMEDILRAAYPGGMKELISSGLIAINAEESPETMF